jgi:L-aminopeptidase/D-esterase-like protein
MTTFKISQMDRLTADGFVVTVHWTATQADGDHTASTYSTASFTQQPDQSLIPYDQLTEAQVIDWVKGSLGEEGVAAIDASLAQQIADQKAPKVAAGVPWGLTE